MARIVVISGDILPFPGLPTTGAGLRAWGLGKGLESRGHEVILGFPRLSVEYLHTIPDNIQPFLYTDNTLDTFVRQHQPDVVVLQHWRLANFLKTPSDIPLVIDLHGPLLLEILFQNNPTLQKLRRDKIRALHKADFITCAGEKQRYYFEAWLLMAGFDLCQDVIRTIPVSLSPELPDHRSEGEPSFVFGGMFLPWQDPVLGLTTLVECLDASGKGVLKFFGGKHPVLSFPTTHFDALTRQLEQSPFARVRHTISRDALIQEYCRSHVAIDVMQRNAERELAFTTRTVEYLWCGLPVIYNDYAELADYIQEYDAGWILDPQNKEAMKAVIMGILEHPEHIETRSRNAQRLVRERLTWERSIEPLDAFCRNPILRKKKEPFVSTHYPSFFSQAAYFKDKLLFHLKSEGAKNVLKRGWQKFQR